MWNLSEACSLITNQLQPSALPLSGLHPLFSPFGTFLLLYLSGCGGAGIDRVARVSQHPPVRLIRWSFQERRMNLESEQSRSSPNLPVFLPSNRVQERFVPFRCPSVGLPVRQSGSPLASCLVVVVEVTFRTVPHPHRNSLLFVLKLQTCSFVSCSWDLSAPDRSNRT